MKYLVMECHPGYAVVLSEDGRFLKAANLRYEVGQTVSDIIEVSLPQPQKQPVKLNNRRWVPALATMAACFVLMVTSFLYGHMPYASVYMTINPEIRIDVNRSDRVVDVEGMNTDGMQLLKGYDPDRKDLDAVMDELVDRAIDMDYLHEGGRIILSLDGSDAWVNSHSGSLNEHLKEHLEEAITVTIDIQQKPQETAESAAPTVSAVPTAPVGPIVIPIVPDEYDDSNYGEDDSHYEADSDYGETDDDSGYGSDSDYGADADSGYGSDSDYGAADADSGYDIDSDYGASDYNNTGAGSSEDDSDYGDSDDAELDYSGESVYDSPDSDDASSDDSQSDYGVSDYDAPDPVPEASDYGEAENVAPAPAASDYGDSGYNDPASDYAGGGSIDYEESDYDD